MNAGAVDCSDVRPRMRVNEITVDRKVPADELAVVPGAISDEK